MSKTISVRVQPLTGRKAGGQRRHDMRDPAHVPDYVDQTRTDQNSVLIEPPDPSQLRAEIEANRKAAGQQKLRADARTHVAGIVTFGAEAQGIIEAMSREGQDALFQRIAVAISKESGHELIGLVVHRDESTPHAHFVLRGYRLDEQGREQPWRMGRADMARLQDIAAEQVKALGIERGERKEAKVSRLREAGATEPEITAATVNRSVRQLHRDLPQEIDRRKAEIDKELAELEAKAEKNRRLIEEQQAKLEAGRVTEEQAQKRIDAYARREADAKEKAEKLESELQELAAQKAEFQKIGSEHITSQLPPMPQTTEIELVVGRKKGLLTDTPIVRKADVIQMPALKEWVGKVEAIRDEDVAKVGKFKNSYNTLKSENLTLKSIIDDIANHQAVQRLREIFPRLDGYLTKLEEDRAGRGVAPTKDKTKQLERD